MNSPYSQPPTWPLLLERLAHAPPGWLSPIYEWEDPAGWWLKVYRARLGKDKAILRLTVSERMNEGPGRWSIDRYVTVPEATYMNVGVLDLVEYLRREIRKNYDAREAASS